MRRLLLILLINSLQDALAASVSFTAFTGGDQATVCQTSREEPHQVPGQDPPPPPAALLQIPLMMERKKATPSEMLFPLLTSQL